MTWRQNPPSRPIAFKTSSFLTFFSCIWTVICHFTDSHISQWLPTRGDYRRDKENEAEVGINFTHLQIRSESSITALQWAALVLLANPFSPPPYVNFTTVSGGGCFSQSGSVNGVHVYLAINVPSIPFPRSHVFVFLSPSLTLPLLPLFAASLPLAWVIWSAWVICDSRLHNLGDDNAWMFSILSSCQSMSHHWIHLNCWTWQRGPRSKAAPICH